MKQLAPRLLAAPGGRLFALAAALACVGLRTHYAGPGAPLQVGSYFARHVGWLLLGGALAVGLSRVRLAALLRAAPALFVASLAALGLALAQRPVGAVHRWLHLAWLHAQPLELARLALVLLLGACVTHRRRAAALGLAVSATALLCALALAQPHLGGALLLVSCAVAALLASPSPGWLRATLSGGVALLGTLAATFSLHGYQRARLARFLDGADWQARQVALAFAAGGLGGRGGAAWSSRGAAWVPEHRTDYALAAWGFQAGLLGTLAWLALWALLAREAGTIVRRASTPEARVVAAGALALVLVPAALNACMVLGLVPAVGVPMPLLSFGGTQTVVCLGALGILAGVQRESAALEAARARAS